MADATTIDGRPDFEVPVVGATATFVLPPEKRVSGRRIMLQVLDVVCEEAESVQAMGAAMRDVAREQPLLFFKEFILPTIPKESLVRVENLELPSLSVELIPKADKALEPSVPADGRENHT